MNTRAVFFDLDGTLVDSMPAHIHAWRTVLADLGIMLDDLYVQLHEGERAEDTIIRLTRENGYSFSPVEISDLLDRKRALYRSRAPKGLIPEARRLVEDLRESSVECHIVTGSVRSNMNGVLSPDELALFCHIITANDYSVGKPAPDPYLMALERSGLPASQCLVLENAPLGIQSAKAAGLTTIAITTTLPAEHLREADHVITHYGDMKRFL